ncbi:Brain-specific serine protease 4 [Tieghemiomyces parasiticus]|uniref:Brain-specific serine protease 4 n=1 Tax=Tieghemiomyces parasiticus TaxID=78921 RepID=A0A9W8AEP6_9FUNG|nr:Brain-specific serine protease 4 [Tieghemiomyces parasiticus]
MGPLTYLALFLTFQYSLVPIQAEPTDHHPQLVRRVVGGTQAKSSDLPFILMIHSKIKSDGIGRCTGIHLADTWLLTAAHCVMRDKRDVVEPTDVQVFCDVDEAQPTLWGVADIHIHPLYKPDKPAFDLALLRILNATRPAPRVMIGSGPDGDARPGTELTQAGWGLRIPNTTIETLHNQTDAVAPYLHVRPAQLIALSNFLWGHFFYVSPWSTTAGTGSGDSGGPLYRPEDDGAGGGGWRVYGLTSSTAYPPPYNIDKSAGLDLYIRLDVHREWLKDVPLGRAQRYRPWYLASSASRAEYGAWATYLASVLLCSRWVSRW